MEVIQILMNSFRFYSNLTTKVVGSGDELECSTVHISQPGSVLRTKSNGTVEANYDFKNIYRAKNIDELFTSIGETAGMGAIGILLSGTNADGVKGLRSIVEHDGVAAVTVSRFCGL